MLANLIRQGVASTRAAVMRIALRDLARERALQNLLQAQREIEEGKGLRGNLLELVKKIED
jgi:hypothetical protein